MKTLLSIILICGLSGQDITDTTEWTDSALVNIPYYTDEIASLVYQNLRVINLLALYEQYEAECLADTIKAIPFQNDYIINHGIYQEWVSERQLEERGYKYKYRWVLNHDGEFTTPLEFEYIFIKEPTFQGFMKWLKEKQ